MTAARILHDRYGLGTVQRTRYAGLELGILFDSGIARWIRSDDVQLKTAAGGAKPLPGPVPPRKEVASDQRSRRIVEALRLGIVPRDLIGKFTFGRDAEIRRILGVLEAPRPNVILVVGEYGSGKSHLLEHMYWRALHNDYAVTSVDMDPNEAAFHMPKRVYSRLIRRFRFPCRSERKLKAFRAFLKEVLSSGKLDDHLYFRHVKEHIGDAQVWEWIEASESIGRPCVDQDWSLSTIPALYDYQNAANIYCYLLSSLGFAAKEVLGLKGLLLVFDEAEAVDSTYYYQFEKGRNFLKALLRIARNDPQLLDLPHRASLGYCSRGTGRWIPFLYRDPASLKIIFAFTPSPTLSAEDELRDAEKISLRPVGERSLLQAWTHTCTLYSDAYKMKFSKRACAAMQAQLFLKTDSIRMFVKSAVEVLDLFRLNRNFRNRCLGSK